MLGEAFIKPTPRPMIHIEFMAREVIIVCYYLWLSGHFSNATAKQSIY